MTGVCRLQRQYTPVCRSYRDHQSAALPARPRIRSTIAAGATRPRSPRPALSSMSSAAARVARMVPGASTVRTMALLSVTAATTSSRSGAACKRYGSRDRVHAAHAGGDLAARSRCNGKCRVRGSSAEHHLPSIGRSSHACSSVTPRPWAAIASNTLTLMHMCIRNCMGQIWADVAEKGQREPTLPDPQHVDAYGPRHRTPAGASLGAASACSTCSPRQFESGPGALR